jgi:hypothetical protein
MLLSDIFDGLSYIELSQVPMFQLDEGLLDTTYYPAILATVNLGVLELYKRFPLKERRYTLPLVYGQTVYPLSFVDLLKVEKVILDSELELSLNDEGAEFGCFTPVVNSLVVPLMIVNKDSELQEAYKTNALNLVYRARHPKLELAQLTLLGPAGIQLELPDAYLQALLFFIASKLTPPIGSMSQFNSSNDFLVKYEHACALLNNANLQVDQGGMANKLSQRGFV